MKLTDEVRKAARDAALSRWVTGSSDTTQMLLSVDAALVAALDHLTDDGAAATPCNCGFGGFHDDANPRCDRNAESATPTAAPSSPHLRDALEKRLGVLPVMAYSNGYMVEALPKAELMGLLAAHPAEGVTPAIDREALIDAINHEFGDYPEGLSFVTALDGGILPPRQVAALAADAALALIGGQS